MTGRVTLNSQLLLTADSESLGGGPIQDLIPYLGSRPTNLENRLAGSQVG